MKKLSILAFLFLLGMVGYSYWNRRVLVPGSKLYVRIPLFCTPRLWGNGVEFDHRGWQEICLAENGKVKCIQLKQASPVAK